MQSVEWAGQTFDLFAQRGMLWRETRTLIVSDPHFGKAAAFRHASIPVPEASTAATLGRLDAMIAATTPRRVLILGDFYHSRSGRTATLDDEIARWRARHRLSMLLVLGNHDAHAGTPTPDMGIECLGESWSDGGLIFRHIPPERAERPTICGHVHPAAALVDRARFSHRHPCFYFGAALALLPAIGEFTGTKTVTPRPGDQVFIIADDEVIALSRQVA